MAPVVAIRPDATGPTGIGQDDASNRFETLLVAPTSEVHKARMEARLIELQALLPRLTSAFEAENIEGFQFLQVWPNGPQGVPAIGLMGRCDRRVGDKLHALLQPFLTEIRNGSLTYSSDRGGETMNVRPWSGYTAPI